MKHRMPEVIERQVTKSLEEWKRKDEKELRLSGLTFKHRHCLIAHAHGCDGEQVNGLNHQMNLLD